MSLLDENFDISIKDIIESKCKQYIRKMFSVEEKYTDKYFDVIWGDILVENVINHPDRYGVAIKTVWEEPGDLGAAYIRICRLGSYYREFLPVKGLNMSRILKS